MDFMETNRHKRDLRNRLNRKEALNKIQLEPFPRKILSFYRYVRIDDPAQFRDELFLHWNELGVLGRIYLATEGINAQLSVPEPNFLKFRDYVDSNQYLSQVPFKMALENKQDAFLKLIIKIKDRIVADGLTNLDFDSSKSGRHLKAEEWNRAMEHPEAIVVDMRNCYESEVGHFENAITPSVETFREELLMVGEMLQDKKDKPLLLYCTGGIRCEKASAWLISQGFENVSQLEGGIIDYARQVEEQGLKSKFKGKNFVFDERKGERITEDVVSICHQCGQPSDHHVNCANDACHLLFVQCSACQEKLEGCCSIECLEFTRVSPAERKQRFMEFAHKRKSHYISDLPYSPFRGMS